MKMDMREARRGWVEFMTTFGGVETKTEYEQMFDDMLDQHNRGIIADALSRAKISLPLENLANTHFIASDGIPSIGMNTNEEAKNQVLKGLDDLAAQYRRGRA